MSAALQLPCGKPVADGTDVDQHADCCSTCWAARDRSPLASIVQRGRFVVEVEDGLLGWRINSRHSTAALADGAARRTRRALTNIGWKVRVRDLSAGAPQ